MPAPATGQVQVSGTAQPLSATSVSSQAFTIKAPTSNANPIFVGPTGVTTATGFLLAPGEAIDYQRTDAHGEPRMQLSVNDFFVVGTSGDIATWLASP